MKNILVFQTAPDEIMDQLFHELEGRGDRLYCYVQSGYVEKYREKYKEKYNEKCRQMIIVDSKKKDFQSEDLSPLQLAGVCFEEIYVPSSSPYFRNYENVFFLIEKLEYRKKILYDCYGNKRCYNAKSRMQKKLQYIESVCLFKIFTYLYKAKNMIRGEE